MADNRYIIIEELTRNLESLIKENYDNLKNAIQFCSQLSVLHIPLQNQKPKNEELHR
jgi:hypothetical protein